MWVSAMLFFSGIWILSPSIRTQKLFLYIYYVMNWCLCIQCMLYRKKRMTYIQLNTLTIFLSMLYLATSMRSMQWINSLLSIKTKYMNWVSERENERGSISQYFFQPKLKVVGLYKNIDYTVPCLNERSGIGLDADTIFFKRTVMRIWLTKEYLVCCSSSSIIYAQVSISIDSFW